MRNITRSASALGVLLLAGGVLTPASATTSYVHVECSGGRSCVSNEESFPAGHLFLKGDVDGNGPAKWKVFQGDSHERCSGTFEASAPFSELGNCQLPAGRYKISVVGPLNATNCFIKMETGD